MTLQKMFMILLELRNLSFNNLFFSEQEDLRRERCKQSRMCSIRKYYLSSSWKPYYMICDLCKWEKLTWLSNCISDWLRYGWTLGAKRHCTSAGDMTLAQAMMYPTAAYRIHRF